MFVTIPLSKVHHPVKLVVLKNIKLDNGGWTFWNQNGVRVVLLASRLNLQMESNTRLMVWMWAKQPPVLWACFPPAGGEINTRRWRFDHYPSILPPRWPAAPPNQIRLERISLLRPLCNVDMWNRSQRPSHPARKNKLVLAHNLLIYIPAVTSSRCLPSLCDDSVRTGCIILHSHIDGSVSRSVTQHRAPGPRWDPALWQIGGQRHLGGSASSHQGGGRRRMLLLEHLFNQRRMLAESKNTDTR